MGDETPSYRLACPRRLAYGVGHVLNDLCASMWFSYLLVFFHYVLSFSNNMAGFLMLLGQIVDAVATPLVGFESDRTSGFCGYTKRKSWHMLGTVCVAVSFPFLFMKCIKCSGNDMWAQFIYYSPFVVIFQIGWAATQISHLSLIPELTTNNGERVELNAIRYAFTVVSSVTVYAIAWLLLDTSDLSDDKDKSQLSPADASKFQTLALSAVGIGMFFNVIFHLGTAERVAERHLERRILSSTRSLVHGMVWQDWFKEHQFYQIAILYMCTRLVVNLSQIYMPMFLTDSLGLSREYIAIVPLIIYLSGFVTSFLMRPLNRVAGKKATYFLGSLLIAGACMWNWFVNKDPNWAIFGPAVLLGAGCSTTLVTSLSMTADLIGDHTDSGAFVYGAMSLTDKLSNGVAVVIIQHLHPCKTSACCPACVWYYRDMIVLVPGAIIAVAVVTLLTLVPQRLGRLRKFRGLTAAAGLPEENAPLLMPPPDNENADPDDCCNFWFCLGTSNDEQVKIIESSCSCSESDFPCSRHQRYLSSYDSFADYTPVQPSHSPRDSDSVSTNMVSGTSNDNVDSFTPHDPSKHQIQ